MKFNSEDKGETGSNYFMQLIGSRFKNKSKKRINQLNEILAENAQTAAKLKGLEPLIQTISQEITARTEKEEQSLPFLKNGYFYFTKMSRESMYPKFFRKKAVPSAEQELLVDLNVMAGNAEYFDFDGFEISPDNRYMAYAYDTSGEGNYTIRFYDLEKKLLLPDHLLNCDGSMAWSADTKYFFYIENARGTFRPYCLKRHRFGENNKNDKSLYHERDEAFSLSMGLCKSEKYIFLEMEGNDSTEIWYLPADNPLGEFTCFVPRSREAEFFIEHGKQGFVVLNNENADNYQVILSEEKPLDEAQTQLIIPEMKEHYIDDFEIFADFLVLKTKKNALSGFTIYEFETADRHRISYDEAVFECHISDNEVFDSDVFRFEYSSFTTPDSIYDYDMRRRDKKLLYQKKLNAGFDSSRYIGKRLHAKAQDGTSIPISMVHRKDIKLNGENPLLMYGYGAYGETVDTSFGRALISLLDRGFVYATAHVRGGGELGKQWYEQGKMMHKKNSFSDFISCTEFLHAQNYSSPRRTFARGDSAGGLLVGAVVNMRPDLYRAVIAEMPFVDLVSTMRNKKLPLTVGEYSEWGHPDKRDEFDYMLSYSPVDRVVSQPYPEMFIISAVNDSRVSFREALKWTKQLRKHNTGWYDILLHVELKGGHFGASDRPGQIFETARLYAFLISRAETEEKTKEKQ